MKISYIKKKFGLRSLELINQANIIIAEYIAAGFTLTLRQLYYQFVARDLLANQQSEYKRLGSIINDARLAGEIDWDAIEDRTRFLRKRSRWNSPEEIVQSCAEQFHVDFWQGQEYRPEVWIEKDALLGVIEDVCNRFDVPFFACRGYTSQSETWSAAMRFNQQADEMQQPIIIHLADHDPSGLDMTKDIRNRMGIFDTDAVIDRIALNYNQIQQYTPPPNPTKMTDSRAKEYFKKYGNKSWELDALSPEVISGLIEKCVRNCITDEFAWEDQQKAETEHRNMLNRIASDWDNITERLS